MKIGKSKLCTILIILFLCLIGVSFNSIIACRIVVLMLTLICIVKGKEEKKLINPYYLFALTPISLMIYKNISPVFMEDLSVSTWMLAILNIGAFICALSLGPEYKKTKLKYDIDDRSVCGKHIVLLSVLSFVPLYLNAFGGIEIPLYSVFTLFYIPALVCACYSKKKLWVFIVLVMITIPWFGNVTKSTVLTVCLALLIVYETYNKLSVKAKIRMGVLCVFAVFIMILAFTYANQIRGTKTVEGQLQYYTAYGNVQWSGTPILFMPYMYLTTPWANLQYVVDTQNVRTYGLWLAKPIISYLQIDSIFSSQYTLVPKSSFNTFGFIAPLFKDFGFWGSIVSSVILGVFVKWVYSRAEETSRPLDVACYVFCAQAVLQMFFSNHFLQHSYPITIVLMVALYRLLFCGRLRWRKEIERE